MIHIVAELAIFEHRISTHVEYMYTVRVVTDWNLPTYLVCFRAEVCEFAANSLPVVCKVDSLVTAGSRRRASSDCPGPGDCAGLDNRVKYTSGTDSPGFSDYGVDGDGSGDCVGWSREIQARASLGNVWCRELGNAGGNWRRIVISGTNIAPEWCIAGASCANAAGGCSAISCLDESV